jgi:hypothetical protein
MAKRNEDAPSDDGIVAEDIIQLVEHIELTGEYHIGSGLEWELATPTDESPVAPNQTDDETQQLPDLQGMEVAEDIELFTETELNLDRRLLQVEDEQLELELAAALAAERARWQQQVEGMRSDMSEHKRQLAEDAQEIENLSAHLASMAVEREASARQPQVTAEQRLPSLADSAIESLQGRLRGRSRALLEAREEIDRLRATRERLVAGVDVRDQFIRQLHAQLRALDETVQDGGELRKLMRHFFGGEQRAQEPAAVSPVVVRPSAELPIVEAAPKLAVELPQRQVLVEDMQQAPPRTEAPVSARSEPRVRRYLIGLDEVGSVCEITLPRINIGRTRDNDLRIVDPTVSRLHAVVKVRGREVTVIDANSRNGIFVNGIQLRYAKLEDGDTLTFGAVRFRYRVGSGNSGGEYGPD